MLISCPPVEPVALVLREYHQRDEICPKADRGLQNFWRSVRWPPLIIIVGDCSSCWWVQRSFDCRRQTSRKFKTPPRLRPRQSDLSADRTPPWPIYLSSFSFNLSVGDRETLLSNLRPEVAAIVLDEHRPAAPRIALELASYGGLDAVHVIAHGAPGTVKFSSGEWSAETVADAADDLATLGDALGPDGHLLLWSCNAGQGKSGRALVDAVSRVTGAPVGAATGLVGSAALGGEWELEMLSHPIPAIRPPLTDAGIAQYSGICATGLGARQEFWKTTTLRWYGRRRATPAIILS